MRDNLEIDAVITWVDGADPAWLAEKNKYYPDNKQDGSANRYRDWDILKYWFRGIEKYAGWFHKIYFVTWGHLPSWLDTSNEKLVVVKHSDFIPNDYLPTFSSRAIEMNIHRISGLSEHFVYFNDDMFIVRPVSPKSFFKKGLPCDMGVLRPISYDDWTMGLYTRLNELIIIGKNFDKRKCVKDNFFKFFTLRYGKYLIENICNMLYPNFTGFRCTHSPYPYLKTTFYEVWDHAFEAMDETCKNRFRSNSGVNPWLLKHWQICKGNFMPKNDMKFSKTLSIGKDDALIRKLLEHPKYDSICISDDIVDIDFEYEKAYLKSCFEMIFPEKSSFEL